MMGCAVGAAAAAVADFGLLGVLLGDATARDAAAVPGAASVAGPLDVVPLDSPPRAASTRVTSSSAASLGQDMCNSLDVDRSPHSHADRGATDASPRSTEFPLVTTATVATVMRDELQVTSSDQGKAQSMLSVKSNRRRSRTFPSPIRPRQVRPPEMPASTQVALAVTRDRVEVSVLPAVTSTSVSPMVTVPARR